MNELKGIGDALPQGGSAFDTLTPREYAHQGASETYTHTSSCASHKGGKCNCGASEKKK